MIWSLAAVVLGFAVDLLVGDPHSVPHPVVLIGKMVSALEKVLRRIFPKTDAGEKWAGAVLWVIVAAASIAFPALVLWACSALSQWLRLAVETVMCWQIVATKSLKDESMKVYRALKGGDIEDARRAVSMIVGRDTQRLDADGICRAAVETVAENTSDGVVAPLLFTVLGGAPLGFFYKAVNTMDSMLGYTEPPYKNIGMFSARADDVMNFIPSRISAVFMLISGAALKMDAKAGIEIFKRDRFNHASPNSAQTEAACAGLLGVRLAGDAWYHGVLHKKKYIGDARRGIECEDIPRACRLLYFTAGLALVVFCSLKLVIAI